MTTIERATVSTQAASSLSLSANWSDPPREYDLVIIAVYLKSATVEVTGFAWGGGTFTRLHRQVGATSAIELWAGYGFAVNESDLSLTGTLSGTSAGAATYQVFRNGAAQGLPTVDVVGATGTSTSADPGSRTPTASDQSQLSLIAGGYPVNTAPTYTDTPGGMEGHANSTASTTGMYLWTQRRTVTSLSAHDVVATIASNEWVALNAVITPTAVTSSADTVQIYKGRKTNVLDNAGVA